uniref:Cytochrome P450 monooxygenase AKT7 ) n=1 Tax=Ganoderma boninense TaxID=34458 RepID=A0A5K1JYQ4_9APHY|nr:Cytochrome P450 monooxygenase AKT7 (EC (AK-toxin biosynthesis protein 7) [Ganoderma boninense]
MNVINVVQLATSAHPFTDFGASVTIPLTTVLVTHFLLDLHEVADRMATTASSESSLVSSLHFAAVDPRARALSTVGSRRPATQRLAASFTAPGKSEIHFKFGVGEDVAQADELEGGPDTASDAGLPRLGDGDEVASPDMAVGMEGDESLLPIC